jgi:nucleoside-diphosphate-sugar epimerase
MKRSEEGSHAKLVTGGTGYIGSETVRKLVNRGEEVIVFAIAVSLYRIEDMQKKQKLSEEILAILARY